MASRRRGWGAIRKLPSGRYQASYTGPDTARHVAPTTFDTIMDAEAWLTRMRMSIQAGTWDPNPKPPAETVTFGEYAAAWLAGRDLKPRTRDHYHRVLSQRILPTFGEDRTDAITPTMVRVWYSAQDAAKPTMRAHAYSLLRAIMNTAVEDELIAVNPCKIRAAGSSKRVKRIAPATLPELATLVEAMPERMRPMVLLAAWCALRFGELTELRRKDIDLQHGVIHIERAVVRVDGQRIVGSPKTEAGVRDVAIPPHLIPMLERHLDMHVGGSREALLFAGFDGGHLSQSTLDWHFRKARAAAGRPDLRFHDTRHTGAVLAASTGATIAELMARLGHSSPAMAMRYQHAAKDRDRQIAEALSKIAGAVPGDSER